MWTTCLLLQIFFDTSPEKQVIKCKQFWRHYFRQVERQFLQHLRLKETLLVYNENNYIISLNLKLTMYSSLRLSPHGNQIPHYGMKSVKSATKQTEKNGIFLVYGNGCITRQILSQYSMSSYLFTHQTCSRSTSYVSNLQWN